MLKEIAIGGVGFASGFLLSKLMVPTIPKYLQDVAKNLQINSIVFGETIPLMLKPLYYYERPYRWGPQGNPMYTRKDGVFVFVFPEWTWADGSWMAGGDIEAFCNIIDWTSEVNRFTIDLTRVTSDGLEVFYKGALLFRFNPETTPNTALPGFAFINIDPSTLDIIR